MKKGKENGKQKEGGNEKNEYIRDRRQTTNGWRRGITEEGKKGEMAYEEKNEGKMKKSGVQDNREEL
jgi:hypothetical protein